MSEKRRRRARSNILQVLVAALCGVLIGILIGFLLSGNKAEEEPVKEAVEIQETEDHAEETKTPEKQEETEKKKEAEETTEAEASAGAEAPETQEQGRSVDAYEAFLKETAVKKNVSAANVDLLVVSGEMYSQLFDPSYPMHSYNPGAFVRGEDGRMTYAENKVFRTRQGIDVSEFNEEIDWESVKEDGIDFVFIRMGYRGYGQGDICEDKYYAANIEGAQKAGLDVGVYFFAQAVNEEEAVEEAKYVLDRLDGTKLQMPIIYDVEPIRTDDARTDSVTGTQFTKNTAAFCRTVEENGYEAGYYANLKWEVFMLDMRELTDYTMWYAGYADQPQTAYDFSIWQYTDEGYVEGVPTNVDMDLQLIPVTPEEAAAIEAEEKRAAEEAARKAEEEAKKAAEKGEEAGEPDDEAPEEEPPAAEA